jgi:hypothetical protein
MAKGLPVKEIRYSLEVVTVYADYPPKSKSDTCFRVHNNKVYFLCIQHAHTSLFSHSLHLYRVLEACLCVMCASNEARTLMMI